MWQFPRHHQFIKHRLKAHHYVRHVDDFVLIHQDLAQLDAWRMAFADFLRDRLGLALRDAGRLTHCLPCPLRLSEVWSK
ncbi:hypothetical protein CKO23_12260 [Thiocystis violacea]|nr:hypothetical protein [Thiocystis violacea]